MPASAGAAAAPIKTTVRVEGARSTLVAQRTVVLADAPIVKDGNPAHSCPGQTALGALQAGTGGDWEGSWSEGLGYYVTAIKGEKPAGSDFFSLWVDHRSQSTGRCDTALHGGESVLLFVSRCDYDAATQGCSNRPVTPLGIRAPRSALRGRHVTLTVVDYSASGRATPEAGATIYANGRALPRRTDAHGHLRVRTTRVGRVTFYAKEAGKARSEVVSTRIRRS